MANARRVLFLSILLSRLRGGWLLGALGHGAAGMQKYCYLVVFSGPLRKKVTRGEVNHSTVLTFNTENWWKVDSVNPHNHRTQPSDTVASRVSPSCTTETRSPPAVSRI